MPRIGFVIDSRLPGWGAAFRGECPPWAPLTGWNTHSAVAEMRFGWIARHVNRSGSLKYELWRPGVRHDAVVFLKSMGSECARLGRRLRGDDTRIVFDANVDYLTPADGVIHAPHLLPSAAQRAEAIEMTRLADAIIADSPHLESVWAAHHSAVRWIPDNVEFDLVPPRRAWHPPRHSKLDLLWSGEAMKLYDLCRIDEALVRRAGALRLHLITGDLRALERWTPEARARFERLLARVEHRIEPFRGIRPLLARYAEGGVLVSPRFLENTYNAGHTEWKLALGMACGRVALGESLSSYRAVADRAEGRGIRICASAGDWEAALDAVLDHSFDWDSEEEAARAVVERHYSAAVVAEGHSLWVREILSA